MFVMFFVRLISKRLNKLCAWLQLQVRVLFTLFLALNFKQYQLQEQALFEKLEAMAFLEFQDFVFSVVH